MKHQFKPFDQVLVRDTDYQKWCADHYSYYNHDSDRHKCISSNWMQCVPYNEETAHLIGTSEPYQEPEPKVWRVTDIADDRDYRMTQKQFELFIKDLTNGKEEGCYTIGRINN